MCIRDRLENAKILEELKGRYTSANSQLQELRTTLIKLEGAIDVLQQIEDSKAAEAQAAEKSDSDVGEGSSVDDESSEGGDSVVES